MGSFHVDILAMLGGNLRVVTTPVDDPLTYTCGWCYQRPLAPVVLAALAFDPNVGEEPVGWIKEINTERRQCGWLRRSHGRKHTGFDADCSECGDPSLV